MEFGQTVLLACWATSILTANSGLMFLVDNNATATNFDAVYFITETVVDVFDARAAVKNNGSHWCGSDLRSASS
jgi:hypothetical protein